MNYLLYFYIALGIIILSLAGWILLIEIRLKKIFRGKKAGDLENIIADINNQLKEIDSTGEEIEKYLKTVESRLKKSIQHVRVIRFNPFDDAGSNQSFAIALLDENGNGAVISSLYSREKVSVYAKPIKNNQSEFVLSKEEMQSINDQTK